MMRAQHKRTIEERVTKLKDNLIAMITRTDVATIAELQDALDSETPPELHLAPQGIEIRYNRPRGGDS